MNPEELKEYLKEHLTIELEERVGSPGIRGFSRIACVKLLLDGEVISETKTFPIKED